MVIKQQTICNSDYYFTQPEDIYNNLSRPLIYYHYTKLSCPFYAPIVPDGMCRLCHFNSTNHRKYYIYSNYARKIQRKYLQYKFKKFYRENQILFKKLGRGFLPYPAAIIKYKILYYRNWNTFTLESFSKSAKY